MSENKNITPDPEDAATEPESDEVLAHSADEDEEGAGCVGQFNRA